MGAKKLAPENEAEEVAKPKGNIAELASLENEYKSGKMDSKKLVALKNKLISLYEGNKLVSDELAFLKLIMQIQRGEGKLESGSKEEQIINRIEKDECKSICKAKKDEPIRFVKQGELYKFSRDFVKKEFYVYVDYIVPGKLQLSEEIVRKEERGHFPPEDKYPKDRAEVHRISMKEKHFNAWFEIETDDKEGDSEEVVYTF